MTIQEKAVIIGYYRSGADIVTIAAIMNITTREVGEIINFYLEHKKHTIL